MKKIKRNLFLSYRFHGSFKLLLIVTLLPFICLFSLQTLAKVPFAQVVKGKVVDENGTPLSGASILEKGTINSTATKNDGSFSMTVSNDKAVRVVEN